LPGESKKPHQERQGSNIRTTRDYHLEGNCRHDSVVAQIIELQLRDAQVLLFSEKTHWNYGQGTKCRDSRERYGPREKGCSPGEDVDTTMTDEGMRTISISKGCGSHRSARKMTRGALQVSFHSDERCLGSDMLVASVEPPQGAVIHSAGYFLRLLCSAAAS
jgi:hypothetical protein